MLEDLKRESNVDFEAQSKAASATECKTDFEIKQIEA